jgi:hypothetical protein
VTDRQLLRLAAAAAIVGGVLRAGTAFIAWNPNAAWLEALALVIDLSCLFGMLGVYLPHRGPLGRAGVAAFAVTESGIASIVGPDTTAFGIDTYQAGVMTLSLGLCLLSALMLRCRAGSQTAACLWIASTAGGLLGLASGHDEMGFFFGGVLFGLAFIAGGISAATKTCARAAIVALPQTGPGAAIVAVWRNRKSLRT